jgi:CheY-like chemotaxis protein
MKDDEKKKTLLLIEDNALLLGLYVTAFERAGFSVLFAHDGASGLAIAHDKQPDGIVLDLLMPGIDGFQVLESLQKNPEMKAVKTIVLTTVAKPRDLERAKQLGAVECLVKSDLSLSDITARVAAHF